MLILGVTSTIVYLILGVRYAYFLGVLTGLLNIIPVVGAAICVALAISEFPMEVFRPMTMEAPARSATRLPSTILPSPTSKRLPARYRTALKLTLAVECILISGCRNSFFCAQY